MAHGCAVPACGSGRRPSNALKVQGGNWAVVCLAATLLALPLAAQQPYPLREIIVEGNEIVSDEAVIAASGLKVGEPVVEADFQEALNRLNDAGLFETLQYRFGPKEGGYSLTFQLSEVQNLYTVAFQGFDQSDEELTALLNDKVPLYVGKAPGDGVMVIRIGNALQTAWREAGHESEVVGQLMPGDGERLVMLFRPKTRIQTISYVEFSGSEIFDALELQRRFNPIAMGEEYSEVRLRELLIHNVRPWFEEKGRMGVEFCPCSGEDDPDTEGVLVKVQVTDGPVYSWGKITPPEAPGISEKKMASIFAFQRDEAVNMQKARDAQSAVDEALRNSGFLKLESDIQIEVNNQARTVSLVYGLNPGPQYTFQRLEIVGLDILSEPVVRKRWGLESGKPYNPSYPAYFLDRIKTEQMFDNLEETRFSAQIDDARRTVSVTLDFRGKEEKRKYLPDYKPENPFP